MVDISIELDKKILGESFSIKKPHMFNDEKTTFKQLKELFTDIFGTTTMKFSKKVPKVDAYLTTRDGDWYVSSYLRPEQEWPLGNAAKLRLKESDEESSNAMQKSFNKIVECLQTIDPVLLNRFFANGNNKLHVKLVCPPNGCAKQYDDACFAEYDGIDCFTDGKKVGNDKKSSFELFKILKASPALKYEFSEITPEQLSSIKCCNDDKYVLKQLVEKLSTLVDGLGWGCTIYDYVQDRYSRYLVNKALEHGIDVSKNGTLVSELASRLSGTSSMRPTKSDLATFAKREGIDVKSDSYREFLDDIEQNADQTNKDIMLPIEKTLCFALLNVANNVLCYASLDPNQKAKKIASQLASVLPKICKSIEDCEFDASKLDAMKKALAKACAYKELAPAEVRVVSNGTPYSAMCECDKIEKLQKVIG